MAENEIKTLQFNQGVNITLAPKILDDRSKLPIPNNVSLYDLIGLSFDMAEISKVIIAYEIYRVTDLPFKSIVTGKMTLLADYKTNTWKRIMESEFSTDDSSDAHGVTLSVVTTAGVGQVKASTTNQAGANHELNFYYILDTNLK